MKTKAKPIVEFDVDEAYAVSTDRDSVYFCIAENRKGWWMTAVVDSDTGHFVDTYIADDGPYRTEREAQLAGLSAAGQWFMDNGLSDYEIDSRLKDLL